MIKEKKRRRTADQQDISIVISKPADQPHIRVSVPPLQESIGDTHLTTPNGVCSDGHARYRPIQNGVRQSGAFDSHDEEDLDSISTPHKIEDDMKVREGESKWSKSMPEAELPGENNGNRRGSANSVHITVNYNMSPPASPTRSKSSLEGDPSSPPNKTCPVENDSLPHTSSTTSEDPGEERNGTTAYDKELDIDKSKDSETEERPHSQQHSSGMIITC